MGFREIVGLARVFLKVEQFDARALVAINHQFVVIRQDGSRSLKIPLPDFRVVGILEIACKQTSRLFCQRGGTFLKFRINVRLC